MDGHERKLRVLALHSFRTSASIFKEQASHKQWKDFVSTTYQHRFQEMLTVLDAVAFKRMDERLMNYIVTKMKQLKTNELHTTHQEVANELGTAREVISRLLKQLEKKKWIELGRNVIYIRDDFEELISK
jgi:CRP/FNR family transcriptional regulator